MPPSTGTFRDIQINGETLVQVKGDPNVPAFSIVLQDLGLTDKNGVSIRIKLNQKDIKADDFGQEMPADIMSYGAEAIIQMTLVHYDRDLLEAVIAKSMATNFFGQIGPVGTLFGGGLPRLTGGTNYTSLILTSPVAARPWRFLTSYLINDVNLTQNIRRTLVPLTWRAIPYTVPLQSGIIVSGNPTNGIVMSGTTFDVLCSGNIIWDRTVG